MKERLFDVDSPANIAHVWHEDHDGIVTMESKQDVDDIVADAKARFRCFDERTPWKGEFHHVARIPMTLVTQMMREGIWGDKDAMRKWLNDPDNSVFRTRPGRV